MALPAGMFMHPSSGQLPDLGLCLYCLAMDAWMPAVLAFFSLPQVGLSTVFVAALISATLLPMGSEPLVFGLIKLNPDLFWPTVLVATAGNTLGGAISWAMGYGAHRAVDHARPHSAAANNSPTRQWLRRFGPKACLLSWLPVVGDPLCAVAGWMKLPFWPCVAYMAVGKFLRYLIMTTALLWVFPTAAPL